MRALVAAVRGDAVDRPSSKASRRAACWSTTARVARRAGAPDRDGACRAADAAASCSRPAASAASMPTPPIRSGAIGQGLALAARAGAVLADLEFVQFHPTALAVGPIPMPLLSEAVRGEGALLVDETGERFMAGRGRGAELAPRDVVARADRPRSIAAGHRVFLDARAALGAELRARAFPRHRGACRAAGIDPASRADPGAAGAHYHMGGIAVDAEGRSIDRRAVGLRRGRVHRPARRQPARQQFAARGRGVRRASWPTASPARSAGPLPAPRPVALPAAPDAVRSAPWSSEALGVVRERAGLERGRRAPAAARLPRRCVPPIPPWWR